MKFIKFMSVLLLCFLAACGGGQAPRLNEPAPAAMPTASAEPIDLTYGWFPGLDGDDPARLYGAYHKGRGRAAVLLPLSGNTAAAGIAMQRGMEIAALKSRETLVVEFFDIGNNRDAAIEGALASGADIILGPLFADDVAALRKKNTEKIPVIAFTSDSEVLGNAIFSLGLSPRQQTERIVRYASATDRKNLLIIAPDSRSGRALAQAARASADLYGMNVVGLYYHDENAAPERLREFARNVALYRTRSEANSEARSRLAEILTEGGLTSDERNSLEEQLRARNSADTLGSLPYDSILFLSNANDTKSLASFIRYYDVRADRVRFFGTAAWDADGVRSDLILSGGVFPGLRPLVLNPEFSEAYRALDGRDPARAVGAGYDAVMIAADVVRSEMPVKVALTSPDGWKGIDGIVRFMPNGESERGLTIFRLNGTRRMAVADIAQENFKQPIYRLGRIPSGSGKPIPLPTLDIDVLDYIDVPYRYTGRGIAPAGTVHVFEPGEQNIIFMDDAPSEVFIEDDFKFEAPERIEQQLLDDVRIIERPRPAANANRPPAPIIQPAPVAPVQTVELDEDYIDVEPF
ncbi:MAG: penicillin-binding protein activator [Alphaproteobacteria bacterium]|nr:penicillin-binding protein activator [Alphaproteobacteria bacterium]